MDKYLGMGLASIGVSVAGIVCMYVMGSSTGIGWVVFGLFIIWAS